MHGVVFLGDRELELREFPDPRPGPGEVVLAMKASGMCGSDLHPYRASRSSGGAARTLGLGGTGGPFIEVCNVPDQPGRLRQIGELDPGPLSIEIDRA